VDSGSDVSTPDRSVVMVLGPPSILGTDGTSHLLTGHAATLLAVLVARHPQAVSRRDLAEALWGSDAPPTAASALRTHLSRLRRALAAGGVELLTEGPQVSIVRADGHVDLLIAAERTGRIRRALRNPGDASQAADLAERTLDLFLGTPFDGYDDDPTVRLASARAEVLRLELEELVVDAALAAGRHDDVLGRLESMVLAEPLRERRWAQLMRAQYRAGRGSAALDTAQRARRMLAELVGAQPGPELTALERSVLVHDPALLVLVVAPDGSDPLPPQLLVGRSAELARIDALLVDGRLVTIVGPAGSGTSTVAAEVVASRVASGESALSTRVPELGARLEQLGDLASDASDPVLVAVDLDGPPDASSVAVVAAALDSFAGLRLVVASRAPLGLPAEQVVRLAPLGPGDTVRLLAALLEIDEPDEVVVSIASQLGGHPMSVRLAATWVDLLGAPAAARSLSDGTLSLAGGSDRAVAEAVAAIAANLPPVAAAALPFVSVFHLDLDVDAVMAVTACTLADAAFVLDAWRSSGLLDEGSGPGRWRLPPAVRDAARGLGGDEAIEEARRRRVRYLRERLAPFGAAHYGLDARGVIAQLGPWHDEVLLLGHEALHDGDLDLVADITEGLLWYWEASGRNADADNWMTSVLPAIEDHPQHPQRARVLTMAATVGPSSARLRQRVDLAHRAVAEPTRPEDARWGGLARLGVAAEQLWAGNSAAAFATLDEAEEKIGLGWPFVTVYLSVIRSLACLFEGRTTDAERLLNEVHRRYVELGSAFGQAIVLFHLGYVAEFDKDDARAQALFTRAIELSAREGLPPADHADIGIAEMLLRAGTYGEARRYFERSVVGRLQVGDHTFAAQCLCGIGEAAAAMGARTEAIAAHRHALQLAWRVGDAQGLVRSGVGLARLEMIADRPRAAAEVLGAVGEGAGWRGRPPRPYDLRSRSRLRDEVLAADPDARHVLERAAADGLDAFVARIGIQSVLDESTPIR